MKLVNYSKETRGKVAASLTTCACAPLSASTSASASATLITTTSRIFVRHYKILIYILAKEKKTLNIKLNDQIIKTI